MTWTCVRSATALLIALTVGGCDVFDPSGPPISVSYAPPQSMEVPSELRVVIAGRRVELRAPAAATATVGARIRGRRYGLELVRVALVTEPGDTLAAVQFSLGLYRNSDHWVSGMVGIERPLGFCIGSIAAAPLRAPSVDSLFVMYGGIPEGAIC